MREGSFWKERAGIFLDKARGLESRRACMDWLVADSWLPTAEPFLVQPERRRGSQGRGLWRILVLLVTADWQLAAPWTYEQRESVVAMGDRWDRRDRRGLWVCPEWS